MTLADKIPNNNISIANSGHARLYIDTKKVMFKVNASISYIEARDTYNKTCHKQI